MILSIIGLPITVVKHKYQAVANSRLIEITPGSNLILFTKELKETQANINNKLLISQNVIDDLHHDKNVSFNSDISISNTTTFMYKENGAEKDDVEEDYEEDIEITLDAYDYSLTLDCQLDFITFDKKCFNCISNENMCFNKVKCYKNYENDYVKNFVGWYFIDGF